MSITYRKDLDRVLSAEEVDNNFLELETKSNQLNEKVENTSFDLISTSSSEDTVLDKVLKSIVFTKSSQISNVEHGLIIGRDLSIDLKGVEDSQNEEIVNYSFVMGRNISLEGTTAEDFVVHNFLFGRNIHFQVDSELPSLNINFALGFSINVSHVGCMVH